MSRRIWLMTKASEGATATRSLKFLMRVFIESGCIYIIVTTSHFIVWWTPNSYAISLVATMVSQKK
ncbi:MAG TPA: hypothetical protein VGO47_03955, partial [Chlamydiales bacterium]|nr:hypothetical protein [Chlamydiales bacterium]